MGGEGRKRLGIAQIYTDLYGVGTRCKERNTSLSNRKISGRPLVKEERERGDSTRMEQILSNLQIG